MVVSRNFGVELVSYAGPLDLLLFLVRRDELDLKTIRLAEITQQFCQFIEVLEELQVDDVGEFIEMASVLVSMKAKAVLPVEQTLAGDESLDIEDPTEELVHRLLEYKKYRDAAIVLDEQSRRWQMRYARQHRQAPVPSNRSSETEVAKIEIWDLVSAFGRILRENQPPLSEEVVFDSTPIHQHMHRIHQLVANQGEVELQSLFAPGAHKSTLVAIFLAALELTRHHGCLAERDETSESIFLRPGADFPEVLEVADVDSISDSHLRQANLAGTPR